MPESKAKEHKKDYLSENMPFLKKIRKALKEVQASSYFHAKRKSESSKNSNDNSQIGTPLKTPELAPEIEDSQNNLMIVNSYKSANSYFAVGSSQKESTGATNPNLSPEKQIKSTKNTENAKRTLSNEAQIQRAIYNPHKLNSGNKLFIPNYQIPNYQLSNGMVNLNGMKPQYNIFQYNQNPANPSFRFQIVNNY